MPASAINDIQTWIQAKKTAGNWFFDDGTAMPSDACPLMNTNKPGEIRLRFNTKIQNASTFLKSIILSLYVNTGTVTF